MPVTTPLKLMCILAHPDDESLGTGGTLAKYAAEGVHTHVVCATRGERGRFGDAPHPGLEIVGQTRENELRAAAAALNVREVHFLDYIDGDLDKAEQREAVMRIVGLLRRVRPHVVMGLKVRMVTPIMSPSASSRQPPLCGPPMHHTTPTRLNRMPSRSSTTWSGMRH